MISRELPLATPTQVENYVGVVSSKCKILFFNLSLFDERATDSQYQMRV